MRTAGFLAAAALVTATMATPALAQDRMTRDQNKEQARMRATQQDVHVRDAFDSRGYWRSSNNDDWKRDKRSDTGFWPGDVAANIVVGAVGAAGAVATAPFRDSYAYYGESHYDDRYAYDGFGPRFGTDQWNARYRYSYQGRVARGATPARNGTYATNMIGATYAERNGFVCQPGTWFTGQDGRQHICQ